jgi:Flp pilus assembly pilin Flp
MTSGLQAGLKRVAGGLGRMPGGRLLARLHRDEQGGMLEYAMVLGFISIPLIAMFDQIFQILSDYFAMIAFYVTWPFL